MYKWKSRINNEDQCTHFKLQDIHNEYDWSNGVKKTQEQCQTKSSSLSC